jgi:hypothetical protein
MTYLDQGADISPCGLYRYSLWRVWEYDAGTCLFIMLNPSTADGQRDDRTIRRCVHFARRERCGGLEVVNLFAFRATKPEEMMKATDPIGPLNVPSVIGAAQRATLVIVAWGTLGGHRSQDTVVAGIAGVQKPLYCLGTTKDGHPRHPLYVPGDAPLVPFERTLL